MKKSKEKAAAAPVVFRSHEWLTQWAFVLALALVAARATIPDFSRVRGETMMAGETPRGPGAATALGLDLLCCLPAILVLSRRAMDRQYILRWSWSIAPLAAWAGWAWLSMMWAADKFAALLGASHLLAALAMVYAASQLVRSWLRLRIVGAVLAGLLAAFFAHSLFYRMVDLPDLKKQWSENREKFLKERGMEDPFLIQQFEQRVLAGELMGFFVSPNTMGAMVVLLTLVGGGLLLQRATDEKGSAYEKGSEAISPVAASEADRIRRQYAGSEGSKKGMGAVPFLLMALLCLGVGMWMIYHTQSRTSLATPLLGISLVSAAWWKRDWLAANAQRVFWLGVATIGAGVVAVVGHGLYHKTVFHESLTFRWIYWTGAMGIVKAHPLIGVGMDSFGLYYLAARLPDAPEEIKDPHNFFIKTLTELGIIGAIVVLAWLGRLAWEVTRPIVPPPHAGAEKSGEYKGMKVILAFVFVAIVGLIINLFCSVDYGADALYAFNETLRKAILFAVLLIVSALLALASLREPALESRPAPLLLYAMLGALAVFLVHNVIDFSLFETGPMICFAFLAGSALGVRQPSVAGKKRHTPAAAVALGAACVAFVLLAGFVYIPTATAEDAAENARIAFYTKRPMEAARQLDQAYNHQPLNADYAYRSAAIWIATTDTFTNAPLERLAQAIRTNPLEPIYYLTRARYLLRSDQAKAHTEQIRADFEKALSLNPHDAPLQVEYADALVTLGSPADARARYQRAIDINKRLKPNEPKKHQFEKLVPEIQRKMGALGR